MTYSSHQYDLVAFKERDWDGRECNCHGQVQTISWMDLVESRRCIA